MPSRSSTGSASRSGRIAPWVFSRPINSGWRLREHLPGVLLSAIAEAPGEDPEADPTSYILDHLHVYEIEKLPANVTSIFQRMLMLVELCVARHIALAPSLRETVIRFVMHFRKKDGGFGAFYATLLETAQALRILDRLGYPLQTLGSEAFVSQCADPVCGFVDIPFTTFSFLEHIHAGVLASACLNRPPLHAGPCLQFLSACQTLSGGFSRSTHTESRPWNTFLAVETSILSQAGLKGMLILHVVDGRCQNRADLPGPEGPAGPLSYFFKTDRTCLNNSRSSMRPHPIHQRLLPSISYPRIYFAEPGGTMHEAGIGIDQMDRLNRRISGDAFLLENAGHRFPCLGRY